MVGNWIRRRGWSYCWFVSSPRFIAAIMVIPDSFIYRHHLCDSHAICAQHSSGMFSQIDLRDSTKPLDLIPRVAATWEASGSVAFVADRTRRWEVPYDDVYTLVSQLMFDPIL
jgi:WD repeat-containing protein 24